MQDLTGMWDVLLFFEIFRMYPFNLPAFSIASISPSSWNVKITVWTSAADWAFMCTISAFLFCIHEHSIEVFKKNFLLASNVIFIQMNPPITFVLLFNCC